MKSTLALLFAALGLAGTAQAETRDLTLSMPREGYDRLDIETGPGALTVTGSPGNEVQATLVLRYSGRLSDTEVQEAIDDMLEFELTGSGSRLQLKATWDPQWWDNQRPWWRDGDCELCIQEVVVQVPAGLTLDIDDGSGETDLIDLTGDVEVRDGSGSLRIMNIDGNLIVDDGSGGLEIERVTGTLDVTDGSGGIDITDIGGDVRIRDGSGGIEVTDVQGGLDVRDGSGNVTSRRIVGPVDIRD